MGKLAHLTENMDKLGTISKGHQSIIDQLNNLSGRLDQLNAKETGLKNVMVQLAGLAQRIDNIKFPEPRNVDLSGINRDLIALRQAINNIRIPDPVDVTPQVQALESKITESKGKRTHTFEIVRDPFTDLITKVNVKETS